MVEVTQLANIAANAAAPVMGQTLVLGTVEYVLLEAAVSMLLRRVIKAQRRPFLQEVALHTIAMPFVGGLGAPLGKGGSYSAPYTDQLIDGSKGIPAVLFAQYVQQTAAKGFHLPSLSVNDLVITAVSKAITRPITKIVYDFAPAMLKEHIERVRLLIARQENASLLLSYVSGFGGGGGSSVPERGTYGPSVGGGSMLVQRAPFVPLPGRDGD